MKHTKQQYNLLDSFAKACYLEDLLRDEIGNDELCVALLRAMSCDDIIDILEYIARCYEVELTGDEENDD